MKKILLLLGAVWLSSSAYAVPATVDYIFDGDTFSAGVNIAPDIVITVRVRLINVDTPEMNGACADEIRRANIAKNRLEDLLPVGETVDLQNVKDDKYLGRIDANVILPDGRDVGDVLVAEGLMVAKESRGVKIKSNGMSKAGWQWLM